MEQVYSFIYLFFKDVCPVISVCNWSIWLVLLLTAAVWAEPILFRQSCVRDTTKSQYRDFTSKCIKKKLMFTSAFDSHLCHIMNQTLNYKMVDIYIMRRNHVHKVKRWMNACVFCVCSVCRWLLGLFSLYKDPSKPLWILGLLIALISTRGAFTLSTAQLSSGCETAVAAHLLFRAWPG